MPTWAPGSSRRRPAARGAAGFTLIELVVVVAIVAIASGLITLAIRDPARTRLEQEAVRLVALLETARTEARAGGLEVLWVPGSDGEGRDFRFVGLPKAFALPSRWQGEPIAAEVLGARLLVLGPDAILPPQRVVLRLGDERLEIASDGLAAFAIAEPLTPEPAR